MADINSVILTALSSPYFVRFGRDPIDVDDVNKNFKEIEAYKNDYSFIEENPDLDLGENASIQLQKRLQAYVKR